VRDSDFRLNTDFTIHTVTEQEVARQITGVRGGSAPGWDGVSADLIKSNMHIILQP
ncbi:hypothetical protein J6590_084416, partial [Homalodisca vitripennis]